MNENNLSDRGKKMTKTLILKVIGILFMSALTVPVGYGESVADYWPAWRGPNATGVAPNGNPPLAWSETENVKWKIKLPGDGVSSPVVWGDKIFFLTAYPVEEAGASESNAGSSEGNQAPFHGGKNPTQIYAFDVVCVDRTSGKILWQKSARKELPHEGHHPTHSFASYSPVTDGEYVWAAFGSRGVHCYTVDGEHKWSRDLGKMTMKMMFGEGSSPTLAGDALIVVMDHEGGSAIYALNKKTGDTIWQKSREETSAWPTPVVVDVNGKKQVIVSANAFVRGYDFDTGEVIWQCAGMTANTIPSPVVGFGKVYCTSGFRGNALLAITLGRTGNLTNTDAVVWKLDKDTPYVPSPLLYGDKIYICAANTGIISCYAAETGKPLFERQRLEGLGEIYASPVGASGRIYLPDRTGKTIVIADSNEFKILATNTLDDKFDASPAIVGKEILLKGRTNLYCIAEP